MTRLLDTPAGIEAAKKAACHELRRRLGRMFHRNIVIAFEEWRTTGTFNLETVVGELNEENTDELILYSELIDDEFPTPEPEEILVWKALQNDEVSKTGDTAWTTFLELDFTLDEDSTVLLMTSYFYHFSNAYSGAFKGQVFLVSDPSNPISFVETLVLHSGQRLELSANEIRDLTAGAYTLRFQMATTQVAETAYASRIRLGAIKLK